jgi:hypothetical protein
MRFAKVGYALSLGIGIVLAAACGSSTPTSPGESPDASSGSDGGLLHDGSIGLPGPDAPLETDAAIDTGDAADSADSAILNSDFDASADLARCETCASQHCQTYSQCSSDPLCLQGLADYVVCTRSRPESDCSKALENDSHVPGDITLCIPAFCGTECTGS